MGRLKVMFVVLMRLSAVISLAAKCSKVPSKKAFIVPTIGMGLEEVSSCYQYAGPICRKVCHSHAISVASDATALTARGGHLIDFHEDSGIVCRVDNVDED